MGEGQNEDHIDAAGETTRIRNLILEGRELLNRLDTSVRNRFRADPQVLAEWRSAARIHRSAKTSEIPPPAPVPLAQPQS